MSPLCLQDTVCAGEADGLLGLPDRGGWFEGDAEVDGGAVGDAALNSSGVVGAGFEARGLCRFGPIGGRLDPVRRRLAVRTDGLCRSGMRGRFDAALGWRYGG